MQHSIRGKPFLIRCNATKYTGRIASKKKGKLIKGGIECLDYSRSSGLEALEGTQAQSQALGTAPYPHKSGDGAIFTLLLNTQVRQRVLACRDSVSFQPEENGITGDSEG